MYRRISSLRCVVVPAIVVLLSVPLAGILPGSTPVAQLSQSHVDSLISHAFYLLATAGDQTGTGYSQQEAIERCRSIIRNLKLQAQGDFNEKYILWKVSELEGQLHLEDQEVRQKASDTRQMHINALVPAFNAHIGNRRPDFAALHELHARMADLDATKGNEIAGIINRRREAIRREVVAALQRSLDEQDLESARRDIAYCDNQRPYLGVSTTQYARLLARVQAQVSIDGELAMLDSVLLRVEAQLENNHLGTAHENISFVTTRLEHIRPSTIARVWDRYHFRTRRLARVLEQKEDSLVSVAHSLINDKGSVAARAFLDTVLIPVGVSVPKRGAVDFALLEVAANEYASAPSGVPAQVLPPELFAPPDDDGDDAASVFDDLLLLARSAPLPRDEKSQDADETRTHMGDVRAEQLQIAREDAVRRREERRARTREDAEKTLIGIYTLLERGKAREAQREFDATVRALQENLTRAELESVIEALRTATP